MKGKGINPCTSTDTEGVCGITNKVQLLTDEFDYDAILQCIQETKMTYDIS